MDGAGGGGGVCAAPYFASPGYEDLNKKYVVIKCNLFSLSSGTCCSRRGWCSHSPDECLCDECTYYEWDDGEKFSLQYSVTKKIYQKTLFAQGLLNHSYVRS